MMRYTPVAGPLIMPAGLTVSRCVAPGLVDGLLYVCAAACVEEFVFAQALGFVFTAIARRCRPDAAANGR